MELLSHVATAKSAEYLIALGGLFTYMLFWRLLNGPAREALPVIEVAKAFKDRIAGFFAPSDVMYHPGHSWVRIEDADTVTIGMNEVAGKIVGKVDSISLPQAGSELKQGSLGWTLKSGNKSVPMLSPVDGEVIAVNERVEYSPQSAVSDPYGNGWLVKVKSPNLAVSIRNLIPKDAVANWLEGIRESLMHRRLDPAMAAMYQDGGLPVEGIAKALDPENWDEIAKEYFLTK